MEGSANTFWLRFGHDFAGRQDPLPLSQAQQSAQLTAIVEGYIFDGQAIELGVLMETTNPFHRLAVASTRHAEPSRPHRGSHRNREDQSLQLMAEQISAAGVPVFAADIKGDLSGVAMPGSRPTSCSRARRGWDRNGSRRPCPTEFFALGGQGNGVPLRATMSSFGPLLLAKVLDLNEVQESSLGLVFRGRKPGCRCSTWQTCALC